MTASDELRPPLEGIEKVHAKFGHLREAKRRTEAEERARADVADLYDE